MYIHIEVVFNPSLCGLHLKGRCWNRLVALIMEYYLHHEFMFNCLGFLCLNGHYFAVSCALTISSYLDLRHCCPKVHTMGLTMGRLAATGLKKEDYSALLARRKGKLKITLYGLSKLFFSSRRAGKSSLPCLSQQLHGASLSGPLCPPVKELLSDDQSSLLMLNLLELLSSCLRSLFWFCLKHVHSLPSRHSIPQQPNR